MLLFALAFLAAEAPAPQTLPAILARVSEEAEVLQQNAPKALTQETLQQRSLMPPSRFRPRVGRAALEPSQPRLRTREIVSEYTVGTLGQSASRDLVEFRQVISVDGRPVQSPEAARHALAAGIQSPDDRTRKRMIEEFAKNGLVDVATDYGLILLAFSKRGLEHMEIAPAGEGRVGTDDALLFAWKQTSAAGGVLEFNGGETVRRALQGVLWVRKSDGLPLRVETWVEHMQSKRTVRDEATVDYTLSYHGFLTPASVVHRHLVGGQLLTENLYRYEPFKLFSADTEIKFTDLPEAAPPPPVKK
ncbi:MAG: hypothetical protein LAP87_22700 [Acidobacteriia bacterium]|nr:hypothetical protein [Terriglobia bacterium]